MDSDLQQNHHNLLNHQNQMNSSLMRYKSAPSSYFATFLESEDCEEFLNQRVTSPETERSIISRFFSTNAGDDELKPEINQFISPMKVEADDAIQNQQTGDYNSSPNQQTMFQNNSSNSCNPPLLNRSSSRDLGSAIEGSFRVPASSSLGMDEFSPMKIGTGGSNSNLIRRSSSPAGLFSNINIDNGFVTMRGMSNLGGGNVNNATTNGETPFSSSSRMRSPTKFASGAPSSAGAMSTIPEYGNKNIASTSSEHGNFGESRGNNFINGFPIGTWDDSPLVGENFSGFKRARDDERSPHSGFETQSEGIGNRLPRTPLSHHLSLPKTSNKMAAMENLLQLEDTVQWKIRAKRGCATHPRSIAERVRRTRISERMRKLQELVPNMDKQTNTADMLDLAVDYIKDLQKEVKVLSDSRAKCTCASRQTM